MANDVVATGNAILATRMNDLVLGSTQPASPSAGGVLWVNNTDLNNPIVEVYRQTAAAFLPVDGQAFTAAEQLLVGSSAFSRKLLNKGTEGQVLTVVSGVLGWATPSAGLGFATPNIGLASSPSAGAAGTVIRSDAVIAAFDLTAPVSQSIGDAAAIGTAAFAARRDHRHGMPTFATPAISLGSAAGAGGSTALIRADATIAAFDATAPVTQAFGDAAATGSAAFAARRDHRHGMPSAMAVIANTGGTGTTTGIIWAINGYRYFRMTIMISAVQINSTIHCRLGEDVGARYYGSLLSLADGVTIVAVSDNGSTSFKIAQSTATSGAEDVLIKIEGRKRAAAKASIIAHSGSYRVLTTYGGEHLYTEANDYFSRVEVFWSGSSSYNYTIEAIA